MKFLQMADLKNEIEIANNNLREANRENSNLKNAIRETEEVTDQQEITKNRLMDPNQSLQAHVQRIMQQGRGPMDDVVLRATHLAGLGGRDEQLPESNSVSPDDETAGSEIGVFRMDTPNTNEEVDGRDEEDV